MRVFSDAELRTFGMRVIPCLLIAGLPIRAWGFSAQGHVWPNTAEEPVSFMLDPIGSDDILDDGELDASRRGFAAWGAVTCSSLSFTEVPFVGVGEINNDGQNKVFWAEDPELWVGQTNTLALTFTYYTQGSEPRIVDADIVMNGASWVWTSTDSEVGQGMPAKVDVETVVFHEIGHFLGLDHSNDPEAAMFPDNNKLTQRTPAFDDVLGICTLYSNGEPIPGAGEQGPVGAPCQDGQDCESSLCLDDQQLNQVYCTATCDPAQQNCPVGYVCEDTAVGAYCFVPLAADELCDLCGNASQCSSGLCLSVPGVNFNQPFCTQACDPTPGQPNQCPSGYQCQGSQQATGFVGTCIPNSGVCDPAGKGGQNQPCYANASCKPGLRCVDYFPDTNLGQFYCYADCASQFLNQACGAENSVCTPFNDSVNLCFTFSRVGEPCVPEVCEFDAYCAWDTDIESALCYKQCPNGVSDCPVNHQCVVYEGLPPLCEPNAGFKRDGDQCTADAECESRTCRIVGNNQLCTRTCVATDPNACGAGLRCLTESNSQQGLCWPSQIGRPDENDPSRGGNPVSEFCSCDTTNQCDSNCDCDPECGSSCSCTATTEASNAHFAWGLGALVVLGWRLRRRRVD